MRKCILPAIVVAILAAVIYHGVLHHQFVYDDIQLVVHNGDIRDFSPGGIFSMFLNRDYANFLPLRMLSYAVDYRFWGNNPVGYHLTNIILHALNSGLVVLFCFLAAAPGGADKTGRAARVAAVAAGILFAVHPLHVEAVTWISGRKEVLYSFFFLLGLLVHARRRFCEEGIMGGVAGFAVVVVCMTAALMSKGTAVAFPFAVLLFDLVFVRKKDDRVKNRWWEHLVLFGITGIVIVVNLRMAENDNIYLGMFGENVSSHILTALKIIPFYVMKFFWPLNLSAEYGTPVSVSLAEPAVIGSVLVLVAGAAAMVYLWRRVPAAAFGMLFFVVALGPVLNIVPFGVFAADRYAYLALLGPCMVLGVIAGAMSGRGAVARLGATVVFVVAAAALAYTTHVRNSDWKDPITFWEATAKASPQVPKVHVGLGRAYMHAGRNSEAEAELKKAIEMDPAEANAYVNISILYVKNGRAEEAIEILGKGLEHNPYDLTLLYNISAACVSLENFECAAFALAPVMAVDPGYMLTSRMFPVILEKLRSSMSPEEYRELIKSLEKPPWQ